MNQKNQDSCFLCGHDAVYEETDYSSRRFYQCSNPACGEYEISIIAMKRLQGASEFKEKAITKANKCVGTENILEITTSSESSVSAKLKPRSKAKSGNV